MSHFAVLVVGPNVDEQLAPYHEFECTGTENQWVQSVDETAAMRERFENETTLRIKDPDGVLHDPYDSKGMFKPEFSKTVDSIPGWHRSRELHIPEGYEEVQVPVSLFFSFVQWASEYCGYAVLTASDTPGEEHKFGYVHIDGDDVKIIRRTNPNAKWDWYEVGGRWKDRLLLTNGQRVDCARKGDINFKAMEEEDVNKAQRQWTSVHDALTKAGAPHTWKSWETIEAEHAARGNKHFDLMREEFMTQPSVRAIHSMPLGPYDTEKFNCTFEEYVEKARKNSMVFFAFLRDGKWAERGKMGWCATVTDEKDEDEWTNFMNKQLDELSDDEILTIVDCHI